jgi:hypothetical protein
MSTDAPADRRSSWSPPSRPDWVERVNAEGAVLDMRSVVPLQPDELVATAMANTGLSDFGEDDWREPFGIYVRSLDTEADLHLMGRIMTRTDLLMLLEARLRLEDLYARHPEIDDEVIDAPLWIFGQGRSGTSLLQTLLALDPANRTPRFWEVMFPVPPADGPDRRRELGDARIRLWNRVTPEIVSMHDFRGDAETETIHAESLSFRCPPWLNLFGLTMTYNIHMASQDYTKSFAYAKRVFKALQWQDGSPRRWVFKSPDSVSHLPELLRVFPDARFVFAHRDPVKALASAVNLIGTLTWIRSDRQLAAGAFDMVTDPYVVSATLAGTIDLLENGTLPREQLGNVQYADLVSDPLGTLRELYRFHGIDMTPEFEAAVEQYLVVHPREERPPHRYSMGTDQTIAAERAMLARYQEYFGVPEEQ